FVLWTVGWCFSCFLPFGLTRLLPRLVAEAEALGTLEPLSQSGMVLARTLPATVVLIPVGLAVGSPEHLASLAAGVPSVLLIAAGWGAMQLFSNLLRGYGKVGLSGVVLGLIAPLGSVLPIPISHAIGGGWRVLAVGTGTSMVIAAIVALWFTQRAIG